MKEENNLIGTTIIQNIGEAKKRYYSVLQQKTVDKLNKVIDHIAYNQFHYNKNLSLKEIKNLERKIAELMIPFDYETMIIVDVFVTDYLKNEIKNKF